MSQPPSQEQQWQQPAWDSASADPVSDPSPLEQEVQPLSGPIVVAAKSSPPTALESTLTVIVSAIWPVAIVAAILGYGSWWWNLGGAIVLSSVIGAINGELAKRRKAG